MIEKTNYVAHVFDRVNGMIDKVEGTNQEVVLCKAAKIARGSKTQYHWKNGVTVFVSLYNKDKKMLYIKTRKF